MGFELREVLRKLCVDAGWSYAVFWRVVCHGGQMYLEWGDGHCERIAGTQVMSGFEAMDKLLRKKAAARSSRECQVAQLNSVVEDKVATLVNKIMVSQVHVFGDEIIGQAALMGTHRWLFLDDLSHYGFVPKVVAEMKHQILAGIQTIAVIPVLPHGAVQLGSCKMVMEDFGLIDFVKNLFSQLFCVFENSVPDVSNNCFNQKVQVLGPNGTLLGHSMNAASEWSKPMKDNQPNDLCYGSFPVVSEPWYSIDTRISSNVESNGLDCSLTKQLSSCSLVPSSSTPAKNRKTVHHSKQEACEDLKSQVITDNPEFRSMQNTVPCDFSKQMQSNSLSFLEEQLSSVSCNLSEVSGTENEHALYDMKNARSGLNYSNIDLFDNLYSTNVSHDFLDDTVLSYIGMNGNKLYGNTTSCSYQHNVGPIADAVVGSDNSTGIFAEAKTETGDLLDAVVSSISLGSSRTVSSHMDYRTSETCRGIESYASGSCANSLRPSSEDLRGGFLGVSQLPKQDDERLSFLVHNADKIEGRYETKQGRKCETSTVTETSQDAICDGAATGELNSTSEVEKLPRKRSRLGENPRPRPKDRQLMQDYIRELRGIVPDGVKCSIDALLEKTIKHMLFLQSVTKYADELKGTAEPRLMNEDESLPIQNKFEGGATWAFEVGSESMACPIIVEDLNSPRQMLVEMLCDERGLFLEIADLIRGLGLTILKGVMEARNGKVWARFTVEANRDVTRMEVFLSLVHLLKTTLGNISKQVPNLCSTSHVPHSSNLLDCLR